MNGLLKSHHGIMKFDAMRDYIDVEAFCKENKLPICDPVGKHWHKIEDATAAMIHHITLLNLDFKINLKRGKDYYLSLYKSKS